MILKLADSLTQVVEFLNKLSTMLTYVLSACNNYLEKKDEIKEKIYFVLKIAALVVASCGAVLFIILMVKLIKKAVKKSKEKKLQREIERMQQLEM